MRAGDRGWRPRDVLVSIALFIAFAAAFAPVIAGQRSFFHFDLFSEHVPVWHAVQQALLNGESPFWIDGQYAGNPLLYTQEAPIFHPLTVPLLLTGAAANRLADLFSLFHFLLAGFLAARLVEEETGDRVAAAFGGVAWMLSARTIQCALWPNAVAVAAFVPGVLLGLLRIGRGQRRSGVVLAGLFGGLVGLSARPQAVVGFLPVVAGVAALSLARAARRGAALKDLSLALLVAVTISAPSLLPTMLLHPEMERSAGLTQTERDEAALTTASLRNVFLPGIRQSEFPEAESYPGVAVWVFVAAALMLGGSRRDLLAALGVSGAIGLVFAFGDAGPYRYLSGLPLLDSMRAPSRFLLSWSLFLAIGAALGVAALNGRYARNRWLGPAAIVALAADLVFHALATAPTAPAQVYSVVPALARFLGNRPPDEAGFPRRHWTVGTILPDARMPDVSPTDIEQGAQLAGALGMRFGLESLEGGGPALWRTRLLLKGGVRAAARLAAVDSVVVSEGVIRVPNPLPRAFVVPDAVVVPSGLALNVLLSPQFDARRTVLLEPPVAAATGNWDGARGSVRLLERRAGRLRLRADVPGPGYLVVLESFEEGWSATVDGADTRVLPADFAFRAIRVEAGRHVVDLSYRPRGVLSGVALAVLGFLLLAISARRLPASVPSPG